MEINNFIQSASSIYIQLAQKKAELANIDKKELEKSTQESYDELNSTNTKYDQKDYQRVLGKFKNLDAQTKVHEQTHASGAATTAPIQYDYQVGPDDKLYATGGSVRFDTLLPKDEAEASLKLEKLQSASSSVDGLSSADAQISKAANLNRLLLQSQELEGVTNAN